MDFDYEGADEFGGRILWPRVAVFAGALVLAAILGSCVGGGGGGVDQAEFDEVVASNSEAQQALVEKDATIAQLQQRLQEEQAAPATGGTEGTAGGTDGTTDGATEGAAAGTATNEQGERIYEVQPGDTLSTIAEAVYGDPTAFGVIASANNLSGSSPIQVGDELIIPANPDQ